jgi:shikimate dehydrogenase
VLHRTAYAGLGLSWTYDAIDVSSDQLPEFIAQLGPQWVGLSLTMPLKEVVLPLLSDVAPDAAQVRAVNTVTLDDTGLHGFNTDIAGLAGLLRAAGVGPEADAVVVGSGATARSAVAALVACEVQQLAVAARRSRAAERLVTLANDLGTATTIVTWPPRAAELAAPVVISTVPAEVASDFAVPSQPKLLVDVIYHPWPTPLASAWLAGQGRVVGGLELLVRQAVEQVVLFTGRRPDAEAMRAAGERVLIERAGRGHIAQAEQ